MSDERTMTGAERTELADGNTIPTIGLGVLRVPDDEAQQSVRTALTAGYRSIDTAATYGNEGGVGRAIRDSEVPRDEVFLTTKVWNTDHGYDRTLAAFDKSVARLGVEHVDLYLIHWPMAHLGKIPETWRALVDLKAQGRARSIGVSNFLVKHLELLAAESDETPVVNQIELHPHMQQHELREYHRNKGIVTQAWSPLGQGQALSDPTIAAIAHRHGRSAAQIILRWHIQLGNVAIPKSSNPARIADNHDVFGFALTDDDMSAIASLNADRRIGSHPDSPPKNPLPYDD
jgi:2,5-diketo-D-gluconate reductase A